jgi:hypothetical protein
MVPPGPPQFAVGTASFAVGSVPDGNVCVVVVVPGSVLSDILGQRRLPPSSTVQPSAFIASSSSTSKS